MLHAAIEFEELSTRPSPLQEGDNPDIHKSIQRLLLAHAIFHSEQGLIGIKKRRERTKDPEEIKLFDLAINDVVVGIASLQERYTNGSN